VVFKLYANYNIYFQTKDPCTAINVRTENTEKLDFNSTVDYNTPSIIIPIMSLLFMSNNFSSFIA